MGQHIGQTRTRRQRVVRCDHRAMIAARNRLGVTDGVARGAWYSECSRDLKGQTELTVTGQARITGRPARAGRAGAAGPGPRTAVTTRLVKNVNLMAASRRLGKRARMTQSR